MSNIENLINLVRDGENVKAGEAFNSIMGSKMSDALDSKKIEVAQGIFGTTSEVTPEPEEIAADADDV